VVDREPVARELQELGEFNEVGGVQACAGHPATSVRRGGRQRC
jgi:hypothetical protein